MKQYLMIGDVDVERVEKCCNWLLSNQREKELELIVNLGTGGDVDGAFAIVALMEKIKSNVNTYAIGSIVSAGIDIFIAGKIRKMHRLCVAMTHEIIQGYDRAPMSHLKASSKEIDIVWGNSIKHYCKYLKKSKSYILNNLLTTTDNWMDAKECLKHGICDKII